MKRILSLVLCGFICLNLMSCGKNNPTENSKPQSRTSSSASPSESSHTQTQSSAPAEKKDLMLMMEEICQGLSLPESETIKLDASNFETYSFTSWQEGVEGVCSESLMNVIAHSLVLIRTEDGKAEALAQTIADKADVRKWICVQAEIGKVLYTDNYVFLIMTQEDVFDQLKANFEKATGVAESKVLEVKSAGL